MDFVTAFCESDAFETWLKGRDGLDGRFSHYFDIKRGPPYPSPLHISSYFNIAPVVTKLLDDGRVQVNARDVAGTTSLHIASQLNHKSIVKRLLEAGAIDQPDGNGSYAIHRAVRRGHAAALRELISGNVDINVRNRYTFTPLCMAAHQGRIKCLQLLCECPKLDTSAEEMTRALELASESGEIEAVKLIFKNSSNLDISMGKALMAAVRHGYENITIYLSENGGNTNYKDPSGQTILHKSCLSGNVRLVDYLLVNGNTEVDPKDNSQRTPLYFAAKKGYLAIVDILIKHKANVNSLERRLETPLFQPAGKGHTKVCALLLENGTDATILDQWNRTPLRFAAYYGRKDIVKLLLENTKIDQNLPDWMSRPVLHVAAAFLRDGQEDIIDLLFEHGADPNTRGHAGGTALHAAVFREPNQPPPTKLLIKRLFEYGVPLNNKDGESPLNRSIVQGYHEITRLLLDLGAEPSWQTLIRAVEVEDIKALTWLLEIVSNLDKAYYNYNGETPLHIAIRKGNMEILQKLLNAGFRPSICDRNHMNALEKAKELEKIEMVEVLRNASSHSDSTLLFHAIESSGDITPYLKDEISIGEIDHSKRTGLHIAVLHRNAVAARQLILAGVSIDAPDELGRTALHYAARVGDFGLIDIILNAKAALNGRDLWRQTPLHLASLNGHAQVVRQLLEAGSDIVTDMEGHSPIHIAANAGFSEMITIFAKENGFAKLVLEADIRGHTALHLATRANGANIDIISTLLNNPSYLELINSQDKQGWTALHFAAQSGNDTITRLLIAKGAYVHLADQKSHRIMAIHVACQHGHLSIVERLLDALPESIDRKIRELESGSYKSDPVFVELLSCSPGLIIEGGYLSPANWSPENRQRFKSNLVAEAQIWDKHPHSIAWNVLGHAVENQHVQVVKYLVQRLPRMPLETPTYHHHSILSNACKRGNPEIVEIIIKAGADVNFVSDNQETSLSYAVQSNHLKVVEILLSSNAKADLPRLSDGRVPLHIAADGGLLDVLRVLARVAFVDAIDDLKQTALHIACKRENVHVIQILLAAEADVTKQDFEGKTPIAIAKQLGNESIESMLQEQAQRQNSISSQDDEMDDDWDDVGKYVMPNNRT